MSVSIDDFLEEGPHYTPVRTTLFGSFNLSKSQIPFFQTVISLGELVKELRLVEELPSDLRAKWRLEELFQREIDWKRVKEDIVGAYLKRQNKLKFFNSLTVALMPINSQGFLDQEYGSISNAPGLPDGTNPAHFDVTNIGGVQLIRRKVGNLGYIRWESKRIFPATIDGQHRLAALKVLVQEGGLTQAQLETSVSVMFLVLDPRAGLSLEAAQVGAESPLLRIVREIFIDLNMHSRTVARSRQILLDDQEIESLCLRTLLAPRIGEDSVDQLPLGLVHWQHNVGAKFNTGQNTAPFITTVELLNLIMKDFLDLTRPKDPLDEGNVRKFVQTIEESLRVSAHIAKYPLRYQNLKSLSAYVEEHHLREGYEQPFVNPAPAYLHACADSFSENFRPLFVRILTGFQPYKQFIAKARAAGAIDGDLAFYMALPERQQEQQRNDWGEALPEKLTDPLRQLAALKGSDWPFFAVFQKALFRATKLALNFFATIPAKHRTRDFADVWIDFLDVIHGRGLLAVKCKQDNVFIWTGIGINTESQTVKWSEAAVSRLSATLLLWWYFYVHDVQKVNAFLKALQSSTGTVTYPAGKKSLDQIIKGITPVVRGGDAEIAESELKTRITTRLRLLLNCARSDGKKDSPDSEVDAETGAAIIEAANQADVSLDVAPEA
jgi:hypothetical protein